MTTTSCLQTRSSIKCDELFESQYHYGLILDRICIMSHSKSGQQVDWSADNSTAEESMGSTLKEENTEIIH